MAQNTINNPEKEGNSVAAKFQKTYSAKELGEMMNTWKIQSELTPRANVSLTPENFLILTP